MNLAERIELDVELPGDGGNVWYYPPGSAAGVARYGRTARILDAKGRPWFAVFANGDYECAGVWQFKTDDKSFVIIQRGAGYRVEFDDPHAWHELPKFGFVRFAQYVEARDLLVLFDFVEAVGYGNAGVVWRSPRLFLDYLEVITANDDEIELAGAVLDSTARDSIGRTNLTLSTSDGRVLRGQPFSWESENLYRMVVSSDPNAR